MIGEIMQLSDQLLPRHIVDDQRLFARLIRYYNHWSNRGEIIEYGELDFIKSKIKSFGLKTQLQTYHVESEIWKKQRQNHSVGHVIGRFQSWYNIEREFERFETVDGEGFITKDETSFETSENNPMIQTWLDTFGFKGSLDFKELTSADKTLFLRNLKMLYASKGTAKCIQVFFSVFFDENVSIYIPKFDIATIDGNFTLDSEKVIRDDSVYQEYSYVVRVERDPSYYQDLIEKLYKPLFHPGGFKLALIRKPILGVNNG